MKQIYAIMLLITMILVSCWQKTWQESYNNDNTSQEEDEGYIEPGTTWVFLSDPAMTIEDTVLDRDSSTSDKNPLNL